MNLLPIISKIGRVNSDSHIYIQNLVEASELAEMDDSD